jgi:carbamoyl-phosphate synthase large subunit
MVTVLVTGCGGAVGLGVIKALRMGISDLRLIGVDSDPYAASFYSKSKEYRLSQSYLVPRADDPKFVRKIVDICRRENVDVIFPGTDAELEKLAISETKIAGYGTKIVISPLRTIRICRDKWLTYQHLNKHLPMVKSALPDGEIEKALEFTGLPAVVKPRLGWGSRHTYKINNLEEARIMINYVEKPIIQTWLEGEEYTVDGVTDRHGKPMCLVPRQRIKLLGGLSSEGVTVRDGSLIELGKKVTKHLKIIGPFNFQVKKVSGEPKIFEINPRFAGTGILTVKAGVNIPLIVLNEICDMKTPTSLDFIEGIAMSRYFEEAYFRIDEAKCYDD